MLGAGLRREFPGASAWVTRVVSRAPRPGVSRSGSVWAVPAALGAQALITGVVTLALVAAFQVWPPVYRETDPMGVIVEWRWPISAAAVGAFAGMATGAAVALRAGSWRGLVGYGLALVALGLATEAIGWRGRALFCERAGELAVLEVCRDRDVLEHALARWPVAAALVTGIVVARLLAVGGEGTNATLEAVGLIALLTAPVQLAIAQLFGPVGDDAMRAFTVSSVVLMAAAALAGSLLVRRGGRVWPAAVAAAIVFFLLPALPGALSYYRSRPDTPPAWGDWLFVAPAGAALAFLLAAVVTAALARSRPPDAGAARRAPR